MAEVFVLKVSREHGTALSLGEDALMRDDADYLESTDAEALALGYPHMEGPRWVRAADILGAFCTGIPSFLENVHGFFAFVVNDRTADRQLVLTDRFGGIAIYYLATRGLIALSDSVEALAKLAGALHLDRQGISEFLETGFMVGDKTHFQEIRKLRPGTINEIVSGEITTTRYWDYAALDCRTAHPGERIASEFNRYVEQGIGYSGRAALPLSGGYGQQGNPRRLPRAQETLELLYFRQLPERRRTNR